MAVFRSPAIRRLAAAGMLAAALGSPAVWYSRHVQSCDRHQADLLYLTTQDISYLYDVVTTPTGRYLVLSDATAYRFDTVSVQQNDGYISLLRRHLGGYNAMGSLADTKLPQILAEVNGTDLLRPHQTILVPTVRAAPPEQADVVRLSRF